MNLLYIKSKDNKKAFILWLNVPKVTAYLRCNFVYENGTVAAMRLSASERGITIKTPKKRELSDEHKAKLLNFQNDDLECDSED